MLLPIVRGGGVRDVGGALEDMSYGGTGGVKPQPLQVADYCGTHPDVVCNMRVGNGVHVGHCCNYPQGWRRVPWNFPTGGALESNRHHHLPAPGRLHLVP